MIDADAAIGPSGPEVSPSGTPGPEGRPAAIHHPPRKDTHVIRLRLHELSQLFNSMDPSPFIDKRLDPDAEEFIVEAARPFGAAVHVRLHLLLDQWPAEDPVPVVSSAVRNHFIRRAQSTRLELRRMMQQGRVSLLIGLVFLGACLVISQAAFGHATGAAGGIIRESLTIAGWVAMWRPMQIYLYDWWPLQRRVRTFRRLSRMGVDVTPAAMSAHRP